ncbi:hypothetical protein GZH46_01839 [Fragariocoptes setiger]|uniref:Uncharacterized protein n=1 Tax=Fragariocoptes setiger TaxID=1670756 RepID=A0ABQ7S8A0_9ACAR|nr:hypothetical protein GZH46_01839 [Fragariocoptes setiger]
MHSSLVALTVISIILIFLMISCFLYFVRAHRKHDAANNNINGGTNIGTDEEAAAIMAAETTMKQQNMSTTKFTSADGNPLHTQSMMYEQPAAMLRPQLSNQAAGYADVPLVAVSPTQQRNLYTNQPIAQQQQQQHQQPQSQPVPASVAQQQSTLVQQQPPQQQRVPVQGPNSQINSAIIGSSEAEFQNDFIQVFPMYQIAPQPEKNTTFANTEYYSAQ